MTANLFRRLAPTALVLMAAPALAQGPQSPVCQRLENQLNAFDRSSSDPARAEQVRRYEDSLSRQQAELDRLSAQARRLNCQGGFFVLFTGQSPQCSQINAQIQQLRANIERAQADLSRLQSASSGPEHDAQRRAILVALSQNDCGAQYRAAVAATQPRGGLFESLFGTNSIFSPPSGGLPGMPPENAGTYRTICVRLCDGYYYPISFATVPARFIEDARICQRSCPAAETALYSHRNPGEDVNQAVSVSTQAPYTALPNAFKYRQTFDPACSCKRQGETWAHALKEDTTIERGDIVVNDERAKQLSQPRVDAQGKPIRPELRLNPNMPQSGAQPGQATMEGSDKPDPNRKVRAVGPTFLPAR